MARQIFTLEKEKYAINGYAKIYDWVQNFENSASQDRNIVFTKLICPICGKNLNNVRIYDYDAMRKDFNEEEMDIFIIDNSLDELYIMYLIKCDDCESIFLIDVENCDNKMISIKKLKSNF